MSKRKWRKNKVESPIVPSNRISRHNKRGLPPGSLVYTGDSLPDTPIQLHLIEYNESECIERNFKTFAEFQQCPISKRVQWLNVDGVHHVKTVAMIGEHFDIHALTLEDVLNIQQRAKFEDYDGYIVVILKMIHFKETLQFEQVTFLLKDQIVISFQEYNGNDAFDFVRQRIRLNKGRIRKSGADYLLYALMDAVVDEYFEIVERIDGQIEKVELQLIENPAKIQRNELHLLKKQVMDLRKAILPMRELVVQMERYEHTILKTDTEIYLRDLRDHLAVVLESIEAQRELLGGLMDLYLSTISNRMNEVMKVLTIISSIFIPVTFVAGVYGMNFDNMPELHTKMGYFIVMGIMGLLILGQLYYFKRKGWL